MRKQTIVKLCCLLLIIFCLTSCKSDQITELETTENSPEQTETLEPSTTLVEPAFPQYIFLYGKFMGGFVNNEWKSICNTDDQKIEATDFYVKDILAQDKYYLYQNREYFGTSNQVLWSIIEDGLGSFEGDGVLERLGKYGESCNSLESFERIFNLPITVGEELSDLKIPDYSFWTKFVVNDKIESRCELVTNSDIQPFPREINDGLEATAEGIQALIDLFRANQMENTVPNFTQCIKSDFDNDGDDEYLMFAENPHSELGYPILCGNGEVDHLGIFNVVFYQDDDGSIQTLYSDLRPYKHAFEPDENKNMELKRTGPEYGIAINLLTAADLNSDGVYEIGVKINQWECGFYLIYAMNTKGEYEAVMRSNWGM